ncbi:MAG: hypothetical protein GY765_32885 [bacterium]|nr:hypothetical protein [bacterium]
MKISNATLQNILNTTDKDIRPKKAAPKLQKNDIADKKNPEKESISHELDVVSYDNDGKVKLNSEQKKALVDFFE